MRVSGSRSPLVGLRPHPLRSLTRCCSTASPQSINPAPSLVLPATSTVLLPARALLQLARTTVRAAPRRSAARGCATYPPRSGLAAVVCRTRPLLPAFRNSLCRKTLTPAQVFPAPLLSRWSTTSFRTVGGEAQV